MVPVCQKFPPARRSSALPSPKSKPTSSAWVGEGQLPDVVWGRGSMGVQTVPFSALFLCPHQECCLTLSPWWFCSTNPMASNHHHPTPAPCHSTPAPVPGEDSALLGLPVRLPLIPLLSSFLNFIPRLQVSLSLGVYATLESPFVFSSVGVRVNVCSKPINRNPKCTVNLNIMKLMEDHEEEIHLISMLGTFFLKRRCNWHITLYWFQVYDLMTQYLFILWSDHHRKSS